MHRRRTRMAFILSALFFCTLLMTIVSLPGDVLAQAQVKDHNEINSLTGLPGLPVNIGTFLGYAVTSIGDLDGDGVRELGVGAEDGIWIIFPDTMALAKSYTRINATTGGFTGVFDTDDQFGTAIEAVGDLDGDGVDDIAVGAPLDDDGGSDKGAVWILFLYADGTVKSHQKISGTQGGFTGTLDAYDNFGISLGALGDLDGDGVEDLAVGAYNDDDGGLSRGAVYILFLNTDGTVKGSQKISDTFGGFAGTLDNSDNFGVSVTSLGDLDGDTVADIAVGAKGDDDTWSAAGAVWILFLNANGTVKADQKISDNFGGFTANLYTNHNFGEDVASPGDLDGDGVEDLMVGAPNADLFPMDSYQGSVYILLLNANGTVKSWTKINDTSSGFLGTLNANGFFGYGMAAAGDVDGDGVCDMAVSAYRDSDCSSSAGAVYILLMNSDGTLKSNQKINCTMGNLIGMITDYEYFGSSAAGIGDWDGNGVCDIAVGAINDKESHGVEGSLWILFLDTLGVVEDWSKISASAGWPGNDLGLDTDFGCAVDSIGDLDGDGYIDLAAGAREDDDGFVNAGAVYILFMDADHTVKSHVKISATSGGFAGTLDTNHRFGSAVRSLGDLDGDGVTDIAVGAPYDSDGGTGRGAVWILFMNNNGTVKSHQKISNAAGGFAGSLDNGDLFGSSLANLGDLDGDGVTDIAAGACLDDDGGADAGAVWVLFMNSNGTVKAHQKISAIEGEFAAGGLAAGDQFGISVSGTGDLDGDGLCDIAVGLPGYQYGAVWLLFLDSDGTVRSHSRISDYDGNFSGNLYSQDDFGSAVAALGDIDGNGKADIAVGSPKDDNISYTYFDRGSIWTLRLEQEPAGCLVTPSSIDFGTVPLGSYSDTAFTIFNRGGVTLSGTISEASPDFSIVSGGGAYNIGPDASLEVTVRYEPSARGIHSCVVETGDAVCSDVSLSGVTALTATIATAPVDLSVSVDGSPFAAPHQFVAGAGSTHLIATGAQQTVGDTTFVFTGWSDGGAASHSVTMGAQDTTFTANFAAYCSWAIIDSIADVPGDQGGWMRMHFKRSVHDAAGEAVYPITGYNIYRRIDAQSLADAVLSTGRRLSEDEVADISRDGEEGLLFTPGEGTELISYGDRIFVSFSEAAPAAAPPGLWEAVTSLYATQSEQYIQLVPSRVDSASTIPWEVFYISAHTTTPSVYFQSPPDSGYSVDNIAPGVPTGFLVTYGTGTGNELAWDPSPEEDFQYFRVYRGTDPDFVPVPGTEVHSTAGTFWTDPDHDSQDVYYKVTALDDAGNESGPASYGTVTGTEDPAMPVAFALGQNVPNPFNPSTTIYYDVPAGGGKVSLRVYDVSGRLVRTLVDGHQSEGGRSVTWDGTGDRGTSVASGIYFYRMTAPGFSETKKMVLLK